MSCHNRRNRFEQSRGTMDQDRLAQWDETFIPEKGHGVLTWISLCISLLSTRLLRAASSYEVSLRREESVNEMCVDGLVPMQDLC